MKKLFILISLALGTAHASDAAKINLIKQIYDNAAQAKDYSIPLNYVTPSFAKELKRVEKVSQNDIDNGTGIACYENQPALLSEDWIDIGFKKAYSVNKQGQVVAQLTYDNHTETVTFIMQCNQDKCLIDDIVDGIGRSKKSLDSDCPK